MSNNTPTTPNIEKVTSYFRRSAAMDRPDYFTVVLKFINNDQEALEHLGFNKYFCYSTFREAEANLERLATVVKSPYEYMLTDVKISWHWFPSKARPKEYFHMQNQDKVATTRGLGYKVIIDSNYYYTLGKPRNKIGKVYKLK